MNALIEMPGKGLARPSSIRGGLALINQTLEDFAETLQVLSQCQDQMHLPEITNHKAGDTALSRAKRVRNFFLPHYAKVRAAQMALSEITYTRLSQHFPVTKPLAIKMQSFLDFPRQRRHPARASACWQFDLTSGAFAAFQSKRERPLECRHEAGIHFEQLLAASKAISLVSCLVQDVTPESHGRAAYSIIRAHLVFIEQRPQRDDQSFRCC